jgi:Tol biopolymer transport system component
MKNPLKIVLVVLIATVLTIAGIYVFLKSRKPASDYLRVEKLTNGSAHINGPKIIFVSNGAIYVGSIDGKVGINIARAIDKNYTVSIYGYICGVSSDKQWVALVVEDNLDERVSKSMLYALNIESRELIKIGETEWETGFETYFISNSNRLVYSVRGVNAPLAYIAVFDFDTKTNTYLLKPETDDKDWAFDFDLSPDEKYLAYIGGRGGIFPDCEASLWLKNLKTGEETLLVKGLGGETGEKYLGEPQFINDEKEILYSVFGNTLNDASYFVTDLKGNVRPATRKEIEAENSTLVDKLKSILKKDLYINAVLKNCNKIIFTISNGLKEELWEADLDCSNARSLNFGGSNFMNFTDSCKFTCQASDIFKWYLLDLETQKQIDLDELYKMDIKSAMYME